MKPFHNLRQPLCLSLTTLLTIFLNTSLGVAAVDKGTKREAKEVYSATEGSSSSATSPSSDDSDELDSIAPQPSAKTSKTRASTDEPELHSAPGMEPSKAPPPRSSMSDSNDVDDLNVSSRSAATKSAQTADDLDQLDSIHEAPKAAPEAQPQKSAPQATAEDPRLKDRIDSLEKEIATMRTQKSSKTASSEPRNAVADLVPEDQKTTLIKRLRLVETLIREHGLAYDYKTLTTQQLESLVAQLHSKD